MNDRKTIVVSAVNLRKGGTLTILRECLQFLSSQADTCRIVAIVHKKELCLYPGIEYIELPDVIKGWGRRLWCEYVTMHGISLRYSPVHLWLSLHDTTPRVHAERQAVYCQTSFPFFKWSFRDFMMDFMMDFKIPLFAIFTQYAYKINVHRNNYLIVQAEWLRKGLGKKLHVKGDRIIVAPPVKKKPEVEAADIELPYYTFIYAATPDCHKNFETLCAAAALLEKELGENHFRVVITVNGKENKYSQWLYRKWGKVTSIEFAGFMSVETLYGYYEKSDCLVFPSRIETWGLPISEFSVWDKPMLLADLPYAHETAAGNKRVAFFPASDAEELKNMMKSLVTGHHSFLSPVPAEEITSPTASSWKELFDILLKDSPEQTESLQS